MTRFNRAFLVGFLACGVAACGSSSGEVSPDAAGPGGPDGALPGTPDGGGSPEAGGGSDVPIAFDAAGATEAGGNEAGNPGASFCTNQPAVASMPDLTGTWAVRVIGAIVVEAPIIGLVRQQMVLTLLVDVTQQGTNLVADGRYCNREQKSEPTALTQVIIPDAWAHTETPLRRPGTYALGSDGTPVVTFTAFAETMGAVLVAPATDPLPTTTSDTRVIDQDHDGNPGITVLLTGLAISGQLYAVQRQITSFTGIPVSADRIEGGVSFSTEQNVLASNPSSLAMLYAQAGQSGADPTVCSSKFAMVRLTEAVDGGTAVACAWLRANETILFGP